MAVLVTPAARRRRGHGDPAPYLRASDGRWVGTVWLPNPGGKPIRKYVYGATQKEAQKKRDRLKATVALGVLPVDVTLGQWCDHWLNLIAPGELKATTIDRHRSYVEQWIKPTIGGVRLQDVQPDHVRVLMRAMEKAVSKRATVTVAKDGTVTRTYDRLSVRTIIKARSVLQAALSQAENDGKVTSNAVDRTKMPKVKVEPSLRQLTTAEARKVIDSATGTRERARLAVALMAGLRQGEAIALRWDHVTIAPDGRTGIIDVAWAATRVRKLGVVTDDPKTLRSTRLVSLSPAAAQMLQAWRIESGGDGYVFPGFRGPDVIEDPRRDYDVWRKALVRAGVPHVRLHDARGTAESHMASSVAPWIAAEMMGHSEDVAKRYYNRSTAEQRQIAAEATDVMGDSLAIAPRIPAVSDTVNP